MAGEGTSLWTDDDGDEPFEVPGGKQDIGLGTEEYRQFKQQVESKRRLVKSEYAHTKRKVHGMRDSLLERYEKLWNIVVHRGTRDIERRKLYKGDRTEISKARAKETDYKLRLLEEVERDEQELKRFEEELILKQNYLATFMIENGRMYSAVEKAEALDTELRRKEQRKAAHKQILDAIQGCTLIDIPEHSNFAERREMKSEAREIQSRYARLRDELKLLRDNEEVTDQLVDRLKNKVEAIDLMEESQVQMIDSQLIKQRKLGLKIKELKQKVETNNQELTAISDKVKSDISMQLQNLISPKMKNWLAIVMCLIVSCIIALFVYFAYKLFVT